MLPTILLILLAGTLSHSGTQPNTTDHPNLAGIWRTNLEKSRYSHHNGPFVTGLKISHQGAQLKESLIRPPEREKPLMEVVYSLDGSQNQTKVGEDELRTSIRWEGQTLVILWRVNHRGAVSVLKRELSLSPDGKTLTMRLYSPENKTEPDQILLLDKKSDSD